MKPLEPERTRAIRLSFSKLNGDNSNCTLTAHPFPIEGISIHAGLSHHGTTG
jgi:hypothetical protein